MWLEFAKRLCEIIHTVVIQTHDQIPMLCQRNDQGPVVLNGSLNPFFRLEKLSAPQIRLTLTGNKLYTELVYVEAREKEACHYSSLNPQLLFS